MYIAFRWLLRLFVGLFVLTFGSALLIYFFASRSLPEYNATYQLSGLAGPVEIVRDTANVPHIYAGDDADVFFALGFAHAQDRLWQMTMLRRTAQGRLSELFGMRTAATDELMRRLDLYELSIRSVAAQDDETRRALEAYSRGVNEWIRTVNENAMGRGAPEFFLFSNEVAYWQPADSIAIVKLLALEATAQIDSEILRARVSLILPEDRVADMLPDAPGAGLAALPDYASLFPTLPRQHAALERNSDPLFPVHSRDLAGASNAWAAAPGRSAAGGSLLANDPHSDFSAPTMWYLAHLGLQSGGVIGATVPGVPLVMAGRSEALGWGITTSWLDDLDIHIEELNPANAEQYRGTRGWTAFTTRRSIIQVKDGEPITVALRFTENGPVIPGTHFDLKSITPPGHVASVSWTALTDADTTLTAGMRLMRAQSVAQGIEAGELVIAPAQNLTLADQSGIALVMTGAMPDRDSAHQGQGRLPSAGWVAANRWGEGRLPYSANPRFVAPRSGIVGNTNNKLLDRPFPQHVSFDWGDTQRIQRWQFLMQRREVHTRESFIEAQLDTVSTTARTLLPLVGANLWFTGEAAPDGTPERLRQRALEVLSVWNGEMNEHLPEPLIYAAWMRALQDRLIRDEMGPLAEAFTHVDPVFIERVFRNVDGAEVWCDVLQSSPVETCNDMARLSLDDALLGLQETTGGNLESWRWGDAHEATHDHPVLGRMPVLNWIVNIRQSTSGGDQTLMRGRFAGTGPEPFLNVHGAGYRGVYDFADPDSSVFITSTGQSGHPLSRHYDDLGDLWRRGEYIPMSLAPELARGAAVGVTVLRPAPAP